MATICVTGGVGFLGRMVIEKLLKDSHVVIGGNNMMLNRVIVIDRTIPEKLFLDTRVDVFEGDLRELLRVQPELMSSADAVIHLASAVSGECEANLDLGLNANLLTGIELGRILADADAPPVLVFASSLAIYGASDNDRLPDFISDDVRPTPQNSYGAQKLMLETLFADLSRKGLIRARTLRLMTVSVRPGKPNNAASSFLSGIIREPLLGLPAVVPVDPSLEVALNSPLAAVNGLLHALASSDQDWGSPLGVNLPGIRLTVREMVEALRIIGGEEALDCLAYEPNPQVQQIVSRWPANFHSQRAYDIGFSKDQPFVETIREFSKSLLPNVVGVP